MSYTFTKLFSSITESTVWCETDRTRIVWICMLAMADRKGRVFASIPGLANRSRVPIEDCRKAIATFLSPDPDSRTPDFEGRRLEPIDGGWRLLNHEKYRAIRDDESVKEAKRKYINERRAAERVENVDHCRVNAEASTEAESDTKAMKKKKSRKCALPVDFKISDRVKDWAIVGGYQHIGKRLEHFIGYVKRSGKEYVDWDEALMGAIREDWAKLGGPLAVQSSEWHQTAQGIEDKGKELGLSLQDEEFDGSFPRFRAAVMAASKN